MQPATLSPLHRHQSIAAPALPPHHIAHQSAFSSLRQQSTTPAQTFGNKPLLFSVLALFFTILGVQAQSNRFAEHYPHYPDSTYIYSNYDAHSGETQEPMAVRPGITLNQGMIQTDIKVNPWIRERSNVNNGNYVQITPMQIRGLAPKLKLDLDNIRPGSTIIINSPTKNRGTLDIQLPNPESLPSRPIGSPATVVVVFTGSADPNQGGYTDNFPENSTDPALLTTYGNNFGYFYTIHHIGQDYQLIFIHDTQLLPDGTPNPFAGSLLRALVN